ncbi:DUF2161 domain-containing phosphodiesterase [Paramaledivibacter caminithermalis]|uniref:Uncharacterized protein n=1 Tax=Paramaledivibacter caminithermalis (strain DSM 15212 / CIP 107654 / DViRD3) TaxID=1121301 RepID=A0A1M6KR86_PARC5|nr:DUF2161 family putative PD-(D/E)XK-type phosphodiesterase [Paramaledivibacter caminithermalis]SHJ61404.1 hypothetical protein SAMN02745912_00493 [Paramaledivibacter caminithermalis DSM 15212]
MANDTSKKILEKDLYGPISSYLRNQGYKVQSEVKDCDIVAQKGEEIIIIELKKSISLRLLIQATKRQKITNGVYIAIPKPKNFKWSKHWKDICNLIKRLEIGLIVVSFLETTTEVEIVFHPSVYEHKKSNRMKESIIREINGRSGSYNIGGSVKEKIMTAYRENAIHIACCLEKYGPLSPKRLRELGTSAKTQSILSKNFYGWFEKVDRGIYKLHPEGKKALGNYGETAKYYRKIIGEKKEDWDY